MERTWKHVFGPVPSRRLGRSLGVDLCGGPVCSLDCIYCQVGPTKERTISRQAFVDLAEVEEELALRLAQETPDVVSFSGLGEPTLHPGLGEAIRIVRASFSGPICVLTNGTLLGEEAVRQALALADVVLPSLDGGDEETFQRINRPHPDLTLRALVDGLVAFRQVFEGALRLEVFLVAGLNDDDASVERIAGHAARIAPDAVELNTVTRPSLASRVQPVSAERLETLAGFFTPPARPIRRTSARSSSGDDDLDPEIVLGLLRRRAVTETGVAVGLGATVEAAARALKALLASGRVRQVNKDGETFFVA